MLPPFGGPHDEPLSFTAAASRLLYVALNLLRVDVGNPGFGNVSAVFSPSFWRDAVVAAPVDTGLYTMACNETYRAMPGHAGGGGTAAASSAIRCCSARSRSEARSKQPSMLTPRALSSERTSPVRMASKSSWHRMEGWRVLAGNPALAWSWKAEDALPRSSIASRSLSQHGATNLVGG